MVVTRNVSDRIRGLLASFTLEVSAGVYCGVRLSVAVRERMWEVLREWFAAESEDTSIVMVWQDSSVPAGQAVRMLGTPMVDLVELDGLVVTKRPSTPKSNTT